MVSHRPFSPEANPSFGYSPRTNPPKAEEANIFWVYILESERDGIYYVGSTQNVEERIKRHNDGDYRYTKGHRPWRFVYKESARTRSEAVKRERFLKSGVGREKLKKILMGLQLR